LILEEKEVSLSFLLEKLEKTPEVFSTAAAARPVLQSFIFPTAIYVGGPTEIDYYAQIAPLFSFYQLPFPFLSRRYSASLLTKKGSEFYKKHGGDFQDEEGDQYAMHYLRTLLSPKNRPQERILNYFTFQKEIKENLASSLSALFSDSSIHYTVEI